MKKILLSTLLILATSLGLPPAAHAGNSGSANIVKFSIEPKRVVVFVDTSTNGCSGTVNRDRWNLTTDHENYEAMFKALLAAKLSGTKVYLVGRAHACSTGGEIIHYMYFDS